MPITIRDVREHELDSVLALNNAAGASILPMDAAKVRFFWEHADYFRVAEQDGTTIVLFAHRGWREEVEFMSHCSMKWSVFLLSLRDLVEKGAGQPSPDDIKIDNWN